MIVAPDGSIFVAEAHNAQFLDQDPPNGIGRISKFSPDGKFIKTFGTYGYGPCAVPRPALARVRLEGPPVRRRSRQPPHPDLRPGRQAPRHLVPVQPHQRPRASTANDTLYAIDSESDDNYNPGWRKGLRVGSARTGEVWYFVPEHVSKQASGMGGYGSMGEGVTVDAQGNVYAGEVGPIQGMTKFIPRLKK